MKEWQLLIAAYFPWCASNLSLDCVSLCWIKHCLGPPVKEGRSACGVWSRSDFCTSLHPHTQVWREEGRETGREGGGGGGGGKDVYILQCILCFLSSLTSLCVCSWRCIGSATDLCFAPGNNKLLISVGQDCKIRFLDIQQRKSVPVAYPHDYVDLHVHVHLHCTYVCTCACTER